MTTLSETKLRKTVAFLDKWKKQPRRKSLAGSFFKFLVNNKRTAAERALIKIRQKVQSSPWHRGYINALEGMVAALDTKKNQSLFLHQIKAKNNKGPSKIFLQHSRNELLDDFDRGYFSAWADYMYTLRKTKS